MRRSKTKKIKGRRKIIIIGGYWYLTSAGNAETAEKGKTAVVNAIIGIVIILMSYAIIAVIGNTIIGTSNIYTY